MPAFVALLRGINVGRAKRIAMADLRALCAELGFGDVRTLLNSGNLVYRCDSRSAEQQARELEQAIADRLGVVSRILVRSAPQLAQIVAANPLVGHPPSRQLLLCAQTAADLDRLRPLQQQDWPGESFVVGAQAAYIGCADGMIDSPIAKAVARLIGDAGTTRNAATMGKLVQMLEVLEG